MCWEEVSKPEVNRFICIHFHLIKQTFTDYPPTGQALWFCHEWQTNKARALPVVNCKMTTNAHLCPPEFLQCHFAAPSRRIWSPFPEPLTLDCPVTCFGEWDMITHNIQGMLWKALGPLDLPPFNSWEPCHHPRLACWMMRPNYLCQQPAGHRLPAAQEPLRWAGTELLPHRLGGNGELSPPQGSSLHQLLPMASAGVCTQCC